VHPDKTPYQIFISDTTENPNGLPEQLFVPEHFDFLLTIGGNLVENEEEYNAFTSFLREVGEKEFFLREHSTQLGRSVPFERRFSVVTKYQEFEKEIKDYSDFGLQVASWYVYGNLRDWGIYLAELPTINIIGCERHLSDKFRQVFKISGSGYDELKDFIRQEFRKDELIDKFEANYILDGT